MVVAVLLGAAAGAAGFAPLVFGSRLARRATATSNLGEAGALLLGVLLSFVILAAAAVACVAIARPHAVPFALGEAGALVVVAIAYGFARLVGRK